MKSLSSIPLLLLSVIMDLQATQQTPATVCELFDCTISRPSSVNANCSIEQFSKAGLRPTQGDALGSFLDVSSSVRNAPNCLNLIASTARDVNLTQTFWLILMCNGSSIFSKGFQLVGGGCLRAHPDIDSSGCNFFRRERLKIAAFDNGLRVSNVDAEGQLIGWREFSGGNDSTVLGQCDCEMFERITKKYDDCVTVKFYGHPENFIEKYLAYGIAIVFLFVLPAAIAVLKFWNLI